MSTTHMSRSVAQLEQRVQAILFHRTTRSVQLTDTGKVFFEHCQRIAQERDEAIATIAERGEPQGLLRVTCSTALGERFIAPLIRRFAMQHQKLSVQIELTNRVVDLVAEGFDLAIRTGRLNDNRLIGTRVASRTLYTCAAPDYLARVGTPRSVDDLTKHECLVGTSSTWQYKVGDKIRYHRPQGRFRCNSGQAVADAAISGFGICQLPEFYVLPHLRHGMLKLILEDFRPNDEPIWAVYPERRHLLPKIQQVIDWMKLEMSSSMTRNLQRSPH